MFANKMILNVDVFSPGMELGVFFKGQCPLIIDVDIADFPGMLPSSKVK